MFSCQYTLTKFKYLKTTVLLLSPHHANFFDYSSCVKLLYSVRVKIQKQFANINKNKAKKL